MTIDRRDVEHIARLAELEVPEAEVELLAAQLDRIVAFVDQLRDVAEPEDRSFRTGPAAVRLRDDLVTTRLPVDPQGFAPPGTFHDGFFTVPRVVGQDEE